jgi:hypothetical protein
MIFFILPIVVNLDFLYTDYNNLLLPAIFPMVVNRKIMITPLIEKQKLSFFGEY